MLVFRLKDILVFESQYDRSEEEKTFFFIIACWGDDASVWKFWVVFETVAPVDPSLVKLS